MGYTQAQGMAEYTDQDTGLRWHLQSNHYPPVTLKCLPAAKQAIEKANAGEWEETITLWNGRTLTVSEIVRDLHLEPWLEESEGD